jgi:hypothetical protein
MTPAHVSAVLQFITLTGAAFWLIVFFWPALREQLEFIRESSKRMDAQEKRMERVAVSIEKLAAVKEDVNWELTRKKVDKVYALAEYWINEAQNYFTAERKMRGLKGLDRLMTGLGRLENMVHGKG